MKNTFAFMVAVIMMLFLLIIMVYLVLKIVVKLYCEWCLKENLKYVGKYDQPVCEYCGRYLKKER